MWTPEEQAAVDAERDAIRAAMPGIGTITEEELERWHVESRRRDAERIASGEATAEEVSRENSFLPPEVIAGTEISNLEALLLAMK